MSSTTAAEAVGPVSPATAEYGGYGSHGVVLSAAKRWVKDDVYVIRSLEFDVWGEGKNWDEALAEFGECLRAVYFHLVMLAREQRATDDEREVEAILTERFSEVVEIHDREIRRKLDWPWRRGRGHQSGWQAPSTQGNSQLVSMR